MALRVSKRDVLWGYAAQFFMLAAGVLVLPVVLRMLSTEEIAMNYLMLTVGAMVALFDFGFAPQFGRNITYVFSGAQKLQAHGIAEESATPGNVNYALLAGVIETARFVYRRLAVLTLVVMLSAGTLYIFRVTDGFSSVRNAFWIWVLYSISTFFNVYYTYFGSLLTGRGMIRKAKKAAVYSRVVYLAVAFSTLFAGMGLMGLVLANLIAPFVVRYLSWRWFYTEDLRREFGRIVVTKREKRELLKIIWPNAWRLGLVMVGAYAVIRMGMFLAGMFLPPEEIASFGLMLQLEGVVAGIAGTLFSVSSPRLSSLRVAGDKPTLIREFSFLMNVFYLIFIAGTAAMILFGNDVLTLIGANARLPSVPVMLVFAVVMLLEHNHGTFATFITTGNEVPFTFQSISCGIAIIALELCALKFTTLGVLGVILPQGLVQLAWPNWYWPRWVFREFGTNVFRFTFGGFKETFRRGSTTLIQFRKKLFTR